MFVPVSRIMTMAMGAVVAFGLIVPLALKQHHEWLAVGVSAFYIFYLIANVVLWRRTKRPSA